MMRELSDNILDIAQNSIAARATLIKITVSVSHAANRISLCFEDNGCGMSPEMVQTVAEPFTTSRKTRKVGLGLPFLKQTALMTGGTFDLSSSLGVGTTVCASFGLDHIDRPPLGDVDSAFYTLILLNPAVDFLFVYLYDEKRFEFDTRIVRQTIEPLRLDEPEISDWIRENLNQEISLLHGGSFS